jgi:hypothetical protein
MQLLYSTDGLRIEWARGRAIVSWLAGKDVAGWHLLSLSLSMMNLCRNVISIGASSGEHMSPRRKSTGSSPSFLLILIVAGGRDMVGCG